MSMSFNSPVAFPPHPYHADATLGNAYLFGYSGLSTSPNTSTPFNLSSPDIDVEYFSESINLTQKVENFDDLLSLNVKKFNFSGYNMRRWIEFQVYGYPPELGISWTVGSAMKTKREKLIFRA